MDPSSRDEDDEGGKSKKKGKKKGKAKNLAAGLALMHGFSATNVGAGRLTVRFLPIRNAMTIHQRPVDEAHLWCFPQG